MGRAGLQSREEAGVLVCEAWQRRRVVRWEEGEIAVVSPEGLIGLKTLRGSGQDGDDIAALRRLLDED
jgi:hypothetical protein